MDVLFVNNSSEKLKEVTFQIRWAGDVKVTNIGAGQSTTVKIASGKKLHGIKTKIDRNMAFDKTITFKIPNLKNNRNVRLNYLGMNDGLRMHVTVLRKDLM